MSCQTRFMDFHPDHLEAKVAQAVQALRSGITTRRTQGWSEDDEGPLDSFRSLTTRERFNQVSELPSELPNQDSLLRWIAALTIERVTWEDRVSAEVARRAQEHRIVGLEDDRKWSVRELLMGLVGKESESWRRVVASSLPRACTTASETALHWSLRRQAAARQLGLQDLSWLETPLEGLGIEQAGALVLEATKDLSLELFDKASGWQDVLWLGAAMDAQEGWPMTLGHPWFRDLFGKWRSLEGLRVEVGPIRDPICGASFTRALLRFGSAVHGGFAGRTGGSFSMVFRPFDISRASYGALFGSLLASVPFLRRRMGLGPAAAGTQAKAMGRSMLLAFRLSALKAILSVQTGWESALEAHSNWGTRALGESLPEELVGVMPRYDPMSATWLAGALRCATLHDDLRKAYDEDWFDNPRAQEQVAEIDVTSRLVLDRVEVERAVAQARDWLVERLE